MPTKRRSRRAGSGTARQAGSTETASHTLVLRVIKKDQKCEWLADFVQQIGEKFFGVARYEDLNDKQRAGWIRFNYAMARIGRSVARGEADFQSLLRFLERLGAEEGSGDLDAVEAEVQAELEALEQAGPVEPGAESPEALLDVVIEERREERVRERAVHREEMLDWRARRRVQLAWDCIVLWATVSCLVLAGLIILGVAGDEARMIGGTAITGGIAVVGLLQVIIWGRWNPPPPGQFRG